MTNSVKNPTVAQQSSFITFASSVTESSVTYDIDADTASITVTPNTYGTLTSATAIRVDSSLINQVTNINIEATSTNPILAASIITFELPLDQVIITGADETTLDFFQLDASGNVGTQLTTTSRVLNSTYIIIKITEWCSVGGIACSAATENIRLRVTGLQNPSSAFPPSNSFKIFVDTSSNQFIDSIESGLLATPTIQAGPLTGVTVARDINVVGSEVTYTIGFTTTNVLNDGNAVFFSFTSPSGLLYESSTPTCTYNTADASTGCIISTTTGTYGNEVSVIKVPMACSTN
jgi:hypothetical protein